LRGTVTTYTQRCAAVRAAERVQGVKAVADDIEVVLPRDVERKDSELAAEIVHERAWNTALPDTCRGQEQPGPAAWLRRSSVPACRGRACGAPPRGRARRGGLDRRHAASRIERGATSKVASKKRLQRQTRIRNGGSSSTRTASPSAGDRIAKLGRPRDRRRSHRADGEQRWRRRCALVVR
jgi:hypothetical protein